MILVIAFTFAACGEEREAQEAEQGVLQEIDIEKPQETKPESKPESEQKQKPEQKPEKNKKAKKEHARIVEQLAAKNFNGNETIVVNNNKPVFKKLKKKTFVKFGKLDRLGRCTDFNGCAGPESIAQEERGSIGMIKPTGWHTVRYDNVPGKYLYNRSHLGMFKLWGNVTNNERNLITGTRYFNATLMLNYEDKVLDYIYSTGNHVMYRCTPVFRGNELLARGVEMEAQSVEDNGLSFNVYCFNIQPGIAIDYATGLSKRVYE